MKNLEFSTNNVTTHKEKNILRTLERGQNLILSHLSDLMAESKPSSFPPEKSELAKILLREIGLLEVMTSEEHYFPDAIRRGIINLQSLIKKIP